MKIIMDKFFINEVPDIRSLTIDKWYYIVSDSNNGVILNHLYTLCTITRCGVINI